MTSINRRVVDYIFKDFFLFCIKIMDEASRNMQHELNKLHKYCAVCETNERIFWRLLKFKNDGRVR